MDNGNKIVIKGAREHNLKSVNVEIPKNKLVVFTGISGSGKSSLAFDTIYAEGQRRYVESLSSYARQFLGIMDKPDVDYIEGLSPAISIDQKSTSHNPRSTVGTITEIYDYLRLLYARIGHPHCPNCGTEIAHTTVPEIVQKAIKLAVPDATHTTRIMVLSPVVKDRKGEYSELLQSLRKKGFSRARIDGKVYGLDEELLLIKTNKHTIEAIVDRLSLTKRDLREKKDDLTHRLSDSIETALKLSDGVVIISKVQDKSLEFPDKPKNLEDHLFSENFSCPNCNLALPEIEPRSFSFNSPHGACPTCTGLGSLLKIDPKLILNPDLSIAEGGILPFSGVMEHDTWFMRFLKAVGEKEGFSLSVPIKKIGERELNVLLYGVKDELFTVEGRNRYGRQTSFDGEWEGIVPKLERWYKETESDFRRLEIERFMRAETCPTCLGTRLKKEALSVTVLEKSIYDVSEMPIKKATRWIKDLEGKIINGQEIFIAKPILKELLARLNFLIDVGLDYLTIDRSASTLAGGEAQRIRLASQIGSGLSGVLYVLDEPSIGLHQRDNKKLIETLKNLRDLGNTVIVVEHDREMMENADYIFDFGPGAGSYGGKIIAFGTPAEIIKNKASITGGYLSGKKEIRLKTETDNEKENKNILRVVGAREHNLKHIDVEFPLGKFICVTGVSGSGKSTLVNDILYRALAEKFYSSREKPGAYDEIVGSDYLDKVILIDQSAIGRTPRSNPATYTGLFTYIRDIFAMTSEARIRGYKPGRFSFNVKGGRCEACQGEGEIKIEMQFLPDVYVKCDVCQGKRYNSEALEVTYKDKNISEVLEMTVEEATRFFENIPPVHSKLETLADVGLDYIKLGQPAPTLSGGEAQRVKLATELSKKATGRTLYILDEPTTGLHFADLEKLLFVLKKLVLAGNTVIVIEHNLDVIKNADWIIDLGLGGGDDGGNLIAYGRPEEIAQVEKSFTGQFLKELV